MSRNSIHVVQFAVCMAAILQPLAANAQTSQAEVRFGMAAQREIAQWAQVRVGFEERWREGADAHIVTGVLEIVAAEADLGGGSLEVGGGTQIQSMNGRIEVRPFQHVIVTSGAVSFRARLEQRFFENADQMGLRLRNRLQFTRSIGATTRGSASAEMLYQLRDRVAGGSSRIEQWRLSTGVQHRISPQVQLAATYQFQIRPRSNGLTEYSHIPQISGVYSF